jgi:DTW domain-containing protein YfiP
MDPALLTPNQRPCCTRCLRAQSACICQWITPVAHQVEVLVLQHPLEVDNAKGSARLLCLSLAHSQLVTGEVFDTAQLQALLRAPRSTHGMGGQVKTPVLLYPPTPHDTALQQAAPPLGCDLLADPAQLRLIVLDGTWRKSRKMLYLNPLLQVLPRLSLRDTPATYYPLRKAHRPDQLSTLEATCAALAQLESACAPFASLLTAFDGFVAQQLGYRRSGLRLAVRVPSRDEPDGRS